MKVSQVELLINSDWSRPLLKKLLRQDIIENVSGGHLWNEDFLRVYSDFLVTRHRETSVSVLRGMWTFEGLFRFLRHKTS